MYDPRIGRFIKLDRFDKEMPNITPYRFGLNNPIRFSDSHGNFEIDEATAAAYPKLNSYLQNIAKEYAGKPEDFRKAFKEYSELTDEQISTMLEYKLVKDGTPIEVNQGSPRIIVADISANGETEQFLTPRDGKIVSARNAGKITLDKTMVDKFEIENEYASINKASRLHLESTIFHESTHYGDVLSDNMLTQTSIVYDESTNSVTQGDFFEGGKEFENIYVRDF